VVVDVAFAPRGDAVAAAVTERVAVWSTRGGQQRAVFAPVADPSAGLIAVAVSDRARTIATGDSKGNVVVWDAVAGVPLGAPLELGPAFGALALSADGRRLAISGKPGVLLVPLDEGEWERAACRLANRGLDAEERRLAGGSSSAHGLDPCA
jgi:hypothetical protein